jgi:hypothetical protein
LSIRYVAALTAPLPSPYAGREQSKVTKKPLPASQFRVTAKAFDGQSGISRGKVLEESAVNDTDGGLTAAACRTMIETIA